LLASPSQGCSEGFDGYMIMGMDNILLAVDPSNNLARNAQQTAQTKIPIAQN